MRSITKTFPGVRALDQVEFDLHKGEVHVLVGENGAGKSTLIKILSGAYRMDAGEIVIDNKPVEIRNPRDAADLGIFTIYQEIMLVPPLTVAENIFLGELQTRAGVVDWGEVRRKSRQLLDKLGAPQIPLNAPLKDLGIAQQQLVAIARALRRQTRILIMDEPTSSLTPTEIEQLFNTIRSLKSEGVGIIYISHRLEEIKQIGDRITVMRDGKVIGTLPVREAQKQAIVRMMVGRDVLVEPRACRTQAGEPVLRVEHFSVPGRLHDICLEVKRGEVVGVAGLIGAGRTELARALFGADKGGRGDVYLDGMPVRIRSPYDAITAGMALVPEDRKIQGIVGVLSVQVNLMLAYGNRHYPALINFGEDKRITQEYIDKLSIRTPTAAKRLMELSGGNQQKVVLARWLCMTLKVLILDEVTRGIDVGAKAEIYRFIDDLACAGYGILMISSELPEILTLSDRILVMHQGRITGEFSRQEATQERIMLKAIGGEN
ncbi:MAG: D-xylose ABC transporter ATP-binding protein [Desulfobacca sp. RBG_16_60_12]|nr:MAG: D-xylose ABC transporter ATP-binding protein [Desulfobacca sp. RBG_16_60_12]